jgi:ribosome-associated toxin RatA of RatAB toxin-antitoxin module
VKALHGTANASVAVPMEQCLALVAAVDRYPDWYPEVVRRVAVVEVGDDGLARRAQAALHVSHGPLVKDFDLLLAVHVEPSGTVALTRIAHGASDHEEFTVTWRLHEGDGTRIELVLDASLSVPRLVPLGGIGDTIAAGFVRAAVGALESPR